MTIDNGVTQRRLREGKEAARDGNRVLARERLLEAVQAEPDLEAGWWALAQVVDEPRERMRALEHVLRLNPQHPEAQQTLIGLRQKRLAERDFRQPDWEAILPQTPLENDDGVDDPYQCPYCGQPAGTDNRRCPHCRGQLYARVARQATPGALGLVVLLLGIGLALGVLELVAPLIALGIVQTPSNAVAFAPLAGISGVTFFLGSFLALSEPAARLLLEILLVRVALLAAAILGLRQRLALAYYTALLVLLADVLVSLYLLITGGLGPGASAINLVLALITATLLVGLSDQFGVEQQRLLVKPDGGAKSALDFYRRGQAYQRRGMWALAVAQWRKAVGLAPKVPDFYKHLGMGYAQIHRYDRSRQALEEAQRQAPNDPDIPDILRLVQRKAERHNLLRH
jgi:tetratricopeptide (TPR) repeat protein